ncbi:hypothetical protein DXB96_12535 [Clostridium sp. OM07-10AC]|nr:hypothetical protein DXB96_12535 [Clostridium sp. OM07-10AC]
MKRNKALTAIFVAGCIAVVAIAGIVTLFAKDNFGNKTQICDGVSIGSIDVGGLTKEQAQKKVETYIADRQQQSLVVSVQDYLVEATAQEAGLTIPEKDYAGEALQIGKKGNLWEKLQEIRKAEKGEKDVALEPEIDEDTLKSFVETKCSAYDIKAKDSRLKFKNGALKATRSREGMEVQVENTSDAIKKALLDKKAAEKDTIEVNADVQVTQPKFTQEEASQCTDLLGKYSTTYATYQVERSSNVATAAGRINGTVLAPGETFSTIKVIKDRTEANGYKSAPEYSSGKVVSGIGGGVCQVSTTLYNAVLNAELRWLNGRLIPWLSHMFRFHGMRRFPEIIRISNLKIIQIILFILWEVHPVGFCPSVCTVMKPESLGERFLLSLRSRIRLNRGKKL